MKLKLNKKKKKIFPYLSSPLMSLNHWKKVNLKNIIKKEVEIITTRVVVAFLFIIYVFLRVEKKEKSKRRRKRWEMEIFSFFSFAVWLPKPKDKDWWVGCWFIVENEEKQRNVA